MTTISFAAVFFRRIFGTGGRIDSMNNLFLYSLVILAPYLFGCVRVNQMFYYPDRTRYSTPADKGLRFEEIVFPSRDGTELSGWFIPAVGAAQGTVLHRHGNAENMPSHFGFGDWLPVAGFNLNSPPRLRGGLFFRLL